MPTDWSALARAAAKSKAFREPPPTPTQPPPGWDQQRAGRVLADTLAAIDALPNLDAVRKRLQEDFRAAARKYHAEFHEYLWEQPAFVAQIHRLWQSERPAEERWEAFLRWAEKHNEAAEERWTKNRKQAQR